MSSERSHMKKRVLILGGGIGGVSTATELAKRLGPGKAEITVVDRESTYVFSPSYLWVLTGKRTIEGISAPMKGLERKGIKFVHGTVDSINPTAKTVVVSGKTLEADYLVIALGAETHMDGLEEVAKAGVNLYSAEGASRLRDTRHLAKGKDIAVLICSMPFKCPAAPYEAAMLLSQDLQSKKTGTRVSVYSPEPGPMPVAGPKVSAQMVEALTHRNVQYFPQHTIEGLASPQELAFANGQRAKFDLLAYVPRHRVPRQLIDCGLAKEGGWAPVDRQTLETSFPSVYVIGDSAGIPLKNGKPLPKAGVFAHGQADVVAKNIAASIAGLPATEKFMGHGACFVEMGGGIAGKGSGNFYAEPDPQIAMATPGPWHHWGKVIFEKYWLNLKY
jgi:sulfide:quinone oxidoreductase